MDIKTRIASRASELFFRSGIRSVTMGEVAEEAGVSKRTLYEHFDNKEELLGHCIDFQHQIDQARQKEFEQQARNPVDFVYLNFRQAVINLSKIHPNFIIELEKFCPTVWEEKIVPMMKERDIILRNLVSDGMKQGYFREDSHPDIAAKLFFAQVDLMSDYQVFPLDRYPRAFLVRYIITGFLRSLATEKGMKEIDSLFNNPKHHEAYE